MPSPLKRPSLGRLLASLRPPAGAGPLPVQTGFPTSLADLVVKNHVRLRKPRKPHRPSSTVAPSSPASQVAAAAAAEPHPQPRPELSPVRDAVRPPKGAAFFSLRTELLAFGAAVALALLVIWSKELVVALTVASLSLLWIESVRSASRRRLAGTTELLDLCGRGPVSLIRDVVESEAETPKSSCSVSDNGSEVPSLWTAERSELGSGGDDSTNPKRKGKRSLRKLIAKKLHNDKKPRAKDSSGSCAGDAGEVGGNARPVQTEDLVAPAEQTPSESSRESSSEVVVDVRGGKFPLAAFIPVILAGLVAGKLPATALTVLCVVFSSAIERLPAS